MQIPKSPKGPTEPTPTHAKAAQPSPSGRPPALPDDRAVTLGDLLLRARSVSTATRELAFLALDDAQRLEYGRTVNTAIVLDAATQFAASAYVTFERLTTAERAKIVGASSSLVDLLVHEIAALRERKSAFDAQAARGEVNRAGRRAAARKSLREGIILRDQVYGALRSVTRPPEREALDAAVGTASNANELDIGMRRIATALRTRLATASIAEREALADLGLVESMADALERAAANALAAEIEATGTPPSARVTQRELDLGDGNVIHLVGIIYRAFREATAALPALVIPPLGELARFFTSPGRKPSAARNPTPAPAPTPPSDPTDPTP